MFLLKLQTIITLPLVIETGQIIYRFEVELNFLAMPTMVVCISFCSENVVYAYRKWANFISISDRIEFSLQCLLW